MWHCLHHRAGGDPSRHDAGADRPAGETTKQGDDAELPGPKEAPSPREEHPLAELPSPREEAPSPREEEAPSPREEAPCPREKPSSPREEETLKVLNAAKKP